MNVIEKNITLADGRVITLETGKLAKQADGAVMLKMGNTMLLATVVSAQDAGPDVDFMPLSVDYKEKFASVGRYPGRFYTERRKIFGLRNIGIPFSRPGIASSVPGRLSCRDFCTGDPVFGR